MDIWDVARETCPQDTRWNLMKYIDQRTGHWTSCHLESFPGPVGDLLSLQLGQEGAGDSEQVAVLGVQAVGDHTVQVELLHKGRVEEAEGRKGQVEHRESWCSWGVREVRNSP